LRRSFSFAPGHGGFVREPPFAFWDGWMTKPELQLATSGVTCCRACESFLDNSGKRCNMTCKDLTPQSAFPQRAEMSTPEETKHESQNCNIFVSR
jgi:hypothetical protein